MRKKIVAGNWKMNNDFDQTLSLVNELKECKNYKDVSVMISPAYPFLKNSVDLLENSSIEVVSQNMHQKKEGAYTGEVSPGMLKSIGVSRTLIGHSERRAYFNEGDEVLLEKIELALSSGLSIIFCFGEELSDRKSNKHFQVVKSQLDNTVLKIDKDSWGKIILAYEPVWAIGSGIIPKPEDLFKIIDFIKSKFKNKSPKVLYGGSVNPQNIINLKEINNIDGFLIGGASQNAKKFIDIVKKTYS